jgi:1,4-dihydroxy-2-naphthoate octaprenyltransferase
LKTAIGVARPNFLILAVACVFIGLAVAIHDGGNVSALNAVLVFVGGVLAHASVNALNEYEDYRTGLDDKTMHTPFSGGTGTLQKEHDPRQAKIAMWTGLISGLIVTAIGVYFLSFRGWPIAIIGLIGLAIIVLYTPVLNRLPLFCLLAPGIGFGTLMVLGTYNALTGQFSLAAVLASFIPFLLVCNLLLLNQFPDVEADQTIGRRHYPILIGRKASAWIFVSFLAANYLVILLGVIFKVFPIWCLLGLISLIFGIPAAKGALQHPDEPLKLLPSMTMNVLVNIITPVLVGIGFLIK